MKITSGFFLYLLFTCLNYTAQTNSTSGIITDVKPYFAGEYALTVKKTTLILIVDLKDSTRNSFEINNEYKDLLIKSKGKYILNPKYKNKPLNISYKINGKGWKCVQFIKPAGK